MANQSNKCSELEIDYTKIPTFPEMLNIQASLQERIMPGFYHPKNSIANIATFFIANKHALEDELGETLDALGGTHDGIGAAAWKWWKADNTLKAPEMTLSNLSERDLLELKFEIVDQFHFFMNQMVKIGMTAEELASMYVAKNKENFNRQERGY